MQSTLPPRLPDFSPRPQQPAENPQPALVKRTKLRPIKMFGKIAVIGAIAVGAWFVYDSHKPELFAKVQVTQVTPKALRITNGNDTAWDSPTIILNDAFAGPILDVAGVWPPKETRELPLTDFRGRFNHQFYMARAEPSQLHGREAEFTRLKEEILAFCSARPSPHTLRIVGISGYGGVGKSYLLSSVLRELKESLDECLIIRLDCSEPKLLADFAAIIDHQLAPHPLSAPGANPKYEYFTLTRKLVRALNKLRERVDRELDHDQRIDENIKKVAKVIYRLRPLASKIPRAGPFIDFLVKSLEALGVEEHVKAAHVKAALETLDNLKTLKGSRGVFFTGD
jgi:hypothetical protein